MKKIIILLLLFLPTMAQTQTTEPVFNKKSNWIEVKTNLFHDTVFQITTYKIDGDTVIDDKIYSKVFRNNNFYSALRETEDNKIYAYFSHLYPFLDKELLIYDFDWYPNKTLDYEAVYSGPTIPIILGNDIDSIQLLDGKYYQCLKGYQETITMIRGIGDTCGFFFSTFSKPTDGSQYALLCFYIDDILIYSNPKFNYCNTGTTNTVTNNDSNIKLYSNPSNHSITVEFPENLYVDVFKIFDTRGSLIKACKVSGNMKIEVQNLAKGAYVYAAMLKDNQRLSGKIIIQ